LRPTLGKKLLRPHLNLGVVVQAWHSSNMEGVYRIILVQARTVKNTRPYLKNNQV
jgi:hypothetical protein